MKKYFLLFSIIILSQIASAESDEERMMNNSQALFEGFEQLRVDTNKAFTQSGGDVQSASNTVKTQIKKYNIMRNNGASFSDLCIQSSIISKLLLDEGNESGYKSWNRAAIHNCRTAKNPPRL